MSLMQEEDKQLRKTAIQALAKIGDMRAAEAFQAAAHDKSKTVRKAATEALQAMGITWI
jgi:HEAT repeat protein